MSDPPSGRARQNGFKWLYRFGPYRRSVLFQSAWEATDKPFLFITHNDVLYRGDIIGAMLERIEGHIAVGLVGQCWNCSAHYAGVCDPDRFMQYRPSFTEWLRISTLHPGARSDQYEWVMDPRRPWPLPECRVNEWSMLVDLQKAKPATMPYGPAIPLGAVFGVDVGTRWFHDVITAGHRVRHMEIAPYAHHAWASSSGGGNPALADKAIYDREEDVARSYLAEHFPDHLA